MNADESGLSRVATWLATLGPIGRFSRRPGLITMALAGATYGWLPDPLPQRAVIVVATALLAESIIRTSSAPGTADSAVAPAPRALPPVVLDRGVGVWVALLPTDLGLVSLLVTVALFWILSSRQLGPVQWVAARAGGRRGVADDMVAGVITGAIVFGASRLARLLV